MIINFEDIVDARLSIINDIKAEFQGVPLSPEHYILAEHRLQTLLSAGLIGTETDTVQKLNSGIAAKLNDNEG